jgi:CHAD domain-containing protein
MDINGFRIFRQEALTETYRRVIREQIRLSLDFCDISADEPDTATHEIRKCTKRIRAVYRLFREASGDAAVRYNLEQFRNISAMLAKHRISKVHIDILSGIYIDKRLHDYDQVIGLLLQYLQKNHTEITSGIVEEQNLYLEIRRLLFEALERVENDPVSPCDFSMLAGNIKKTFRKTKENLAVLQNEYSAENLHTLRKSAKCLWNQIILVKPVWTSWLGMIIRDLDLLAEKLGQDHDLDELYHFLRTDKGIRYIQVPEPLLQHILRKRNHLGKIIIPMASRLFAEKPGAFSGRLSHCYRIFLGETGKI